MHSVIYITRKTDLLDLHTTSEITLPEWTSFVLNDPEMRLDNYTTVTLANGEDYRYTNPGAAVFLKRERGQSAVQEILFDFIAGSIRIYDADEQTEAKIRQIAFKLNARVFKETKSYTVEIPQYVAMQQPKARFYFKDFLSPLKKLLPQLRYRLQQLSFSLFRHGKIAAAKQTEKSGKPVLSIPVVKVKRSA